MDRKELLREINLSSYVAFDFETTGLRFSSDRIIEVAALRFVDGEISDRFVTLVNPNQIILHDYKNLPGLRIKWWQTNL